MLSVAAFSNLTSVVCKGYNKIMPRIATKMPKPMSIRLTPEAYSLLTLLSELTGKEKVMVIDQAIRDMAEKKNLTEEKTRLDSIRSEISRLETVAASIRSLK